jgi:hypothetical protein
MNRITIVRTIALAAVSAAALLVTPLAVAAQESATSAIVAPAAPLVSAPTSPAAAPRLGPVDAPAGIARAEAGTPQLSLQSSGRDNRNVVWMIVGGGMMLGGSLIGDDVGTIVSVTGLVIGLVGLYRYLR